MATTSRIRRVRNVFNRRRTKGTVLTTDSTSRPTGALPPEPEATLESQLTLLDSHRKLGSGPLVSGLTAQLCPWNPDIAKGVAEAAQLGFKRIEGNGWWAFAGDRPDALNAAVPKAGVDITGLYLPIPLLDPAQKARSVRAARDAAKYIAEHGGNALVIGPPGKTKERLDEGEIAAATDILNAVGTAAKRYGVRVALHQHMWTTVQDPEDFEKLIQATNPETVAMCIDTAHLTRAGGDPVALIRKYPGRLANIHLKDFRRNDKGELAWCELGRGQVNFAEVFDALSDTGYRGPVVIEMENVPDPKASVRESLEHVLPLMQAADRKALAKNPVGIGVVGCGLVSDKYLENLAHSPEVKLVACADLDGHAAQRTAEKYGMAVTDNAGLFNDPRVDIVLNLTPPKQHAQVTMDALRSGKHVYSEKPLGLTAAETSAIEALAQSQGLHVGCAPDTLLGDGWQKTFELIRNGVIGRPFSATVTMTRQGSESWRHNADVMYQQGAGPLFDMGPYYIGALVNIFGPVKRVVGATTQTVREKRQLQAGPRAGQWFDVETPTHVEAMLEFANGESAQLTFSFDTAQTQLPRFEVRGSAGTLHLGDPNDFRGVVWQDSADGTRRMALTAGKSTNDRGLGVVEMAEAVRAGRPPLASSAMAAHTVEVMEGILAAGITKRPVSIASARRLVDRSTNPGPQHQV